MNMTFFALLLGMLLAAAGFVAVPLYPAGASRNRGFAKLAPLLVVVIIGASIALYAAIGRPDLTNTAEDGSRPGQSAAADLRRPAGAKNGNAGSVASLLAGLEERLERNPDDAGGWLLLAKSYAHLGRSDDAMAAYARAQALGQSDAAFESQMGQADPHESLSIHGTVSLTDRAAARVSPGDTVFVIARSADGNPMPLAVFKRPAADLPFDFELTDSDAMVPGRGIASADEVSIFAKISASGDALSTKDGLATRESLVDPTEASNIRLNIDVPGDQ